MTESKSSNVGNVNDSKTMNDCTNFKFIKGDLKSRFSI